MNKSNIKEEILAKLPESSAAIIKPFLPMFSNDELSIKGDNLEVEIDGRKQLFSLCEKGVSNLSQAIGSSPVMHHI